MSCCTFGMGDGAPIRIPTPDLGGLVLWTGGDGSIITSANDPTPEARCIGWSNLVNPINGDLFAALSGFGDGPFTGINTLDGHPGLTWRIDRDNTQNMNLDSVPPTGVPQAMKATNGQFLGSLVGQNAPISIVVVMQPRYFPGFAAGEAHIGGTVAYFSAGGPYYGPLFDLESQVAPDQFYAFSDDFDWRTDRGTSFVLNAPDTVGGPGSFYDNRPIVAEWSSNSPTEISFYVDGVQLALLPAVIDPGAILSGISWILGNRTPGDRITRYYGAMYEILVYDFKLSDNPTARTQLYTYLADRYPSISITIP